MPVSTIPQTPQTDLRCLRNVPLFRKPHFCPVLIHFLRFWPNCLPKASKVTIFWFLRVPFEIQEHDVFRPHPTNRWHCNFFIITIRKKNLSLKIMSTSLTTQLYMFEAFSNINSDTFLRILQKSIVSDWIKMCWERIRMALVAGATPGISRDSGKHQSTNNKARKQQIGT